MTALDLRVPPVVVAAVVAGLMWFAAALTPALALDLPGRVVLAAVFAGVGVAIAVAGVLAFGQASTTVNPHRPEGTSALVTTGVYRRTRNPMYLGLLLALVGWAVWLGHLLSVLIVPLFAAYMTRFQIEPEERALRARFGESFEAYTRSTRRWL